MTAPFKAACVQTTSLPEIEPSIAEAVEGIRAARDHGANLIMLPESVNIMDLNKQNILEKVKVEEEASSLQTFRAMARETGAWILVGSLIIKLDENRLANRSYLINSVGDIVASYDKIHMFDVDLEGGESYRESALYQPGNKAVLADTPWGGLGMTICYDLRFPHLFRKLAKAGASFITVPAAFTRPTGSAHWHSLLRARAIENGCYIFAPGQCGNHEGGRETYGHSLIVDPWGEILADGGEGKGIILADIDPARVAEVRTMIPSLTHDRSFD